MGARDTPFSPKHTHTRAGGVGACTCIYTHTRAPLACSQKPGEAPLSLSNAHTRAHTCVHLSLAHATRCYHTYNCEHGMCIWGNICCVLCLAVRCVYPPPYTHTHTHSLEDVWVLHRTQDGSFCTPLLLCCCVEADHLHGTRLPPATRPAGSSQTMAIPTRPAMLDGFTAHARLAGLTARPIAGSFTAHRRLADRSGVPCCGGGLVVHPAGGRNVAFVPCSCGVQGSGSAGCPTLWRADTGTVGTRLRHTMRGIVCCDAYQVRRALLVTAT